MNREDIIRMAREAQSVYATETWTFSLSENQLERFAALVAAAARAEENEACAKVCADLHIEGEDDTGLAADSIRARGETK